MASVENNQQDQKNKPNEAPGHLRLIYKHLVKDGQSISDLVNMLNIQSALLKRLHGTDSGGIQTNIDNALRFLQTYRDDILFKLY